MRIHIDHEYRCGIDTFWDKVFFDDEYNRRLFLEGLHFKAYEKLELTDRGDSILRRIRGTPASEIPGALQKVIGADLSYVEDLTFDKKARRCTFKNTPARMAEKLRIEGSIYAEPSGTGRCRRIVDLDLEAKFFGVGGLIESFAAKAFRDNFDKAATWTNRWLTEVSLEGK
ncbi:MAG: DUF2505 domain-containing protein [Deltaproteobacteria bacterium]|nr:DUF2505 domain-containing protein [Deltaproteobacteria bacterium]